MKKIIYKKNSPFISFKGEWRNLVELVRAELTPKELTPKELTDAAGRLSWLAEEPPWTQQAPPTPASSANDAGLGAALRKCLPKQPHRHQPVYEWEFVGRFSTHSIHQLFFYDRH